MGHCAVRVGGQIYHLFGVDENYVPILDVQVFNIGQSYTSYYYRGGVSPS